MGIFQISFKNIILIDLSIISGFGFILPLFSNLMEYTIKIQFIQILGNMLLILPLIVLLIDFLYLLIRKENNIL
ncbi:MAG: hypothetical protein ACFE9R_18115, partial [Candidatus Hermodarchaeota archaeon]